VKTTITKRLTFCSGHRLYNPEYSDEKNYEIFGDCANPGGHGHNYVLEVTVTGPVDPDTGMIVNLKDMKRVIMDEIITRVDHRNLNTDVDFMKGVIPTTENFARKIWEILDKEFGDQRLEKIVLWESENNRVEVTRQKKGDTF
jgi:6-pyruvoyltetrahydropterin/6-carboxytetrahydropterin synthase